MVEDRIRLCPFRFTLLPGSSASLITFVYVDRWDYSWIKKSHRRDILYLSNKDMLFGEKDLFLEECFDSWWNDLMIWVNKLLLMTLSCSLKEVGHLLWGWQLKYKCRESESAKRTRIFNQWWKGSPTKDPQDPTPAWMNATLIMYHLLQQLLSEVADCNTPLLLLLWLITPVQRNHLLFQQENILFCYTHRKLLTFILIPASH